ncbi:MAG: RdgB/HAM1 family non-canonical purine NTP pyrophosphatase [Clostridia bacterium]
MKLIIASNNAHKVMEIKAILAPYFSSILSLADAGLKIDVVEDGNTFEANAIKKAVEVLALVQNQDIAVLSDDSGLMVDAINGAPGVYSARFAGEGHDDEGNNRKLLQLMNDIPDAQRTCRFVSVVALARNNNMPTLIARGSVEGRLLWQYRGNNGFGYDPLFLYEPLQKSFAELNAEEKNTISHRKQALEALRKQLENEIQ